MPTSRFVRWLVRPLSLLYIFDAIFVLLQATKSALLNMLYSSDVLFKKLVSLFSMPPQDMREQHNREKLVLLMHLIGHWLGSHTYHIKTFATRESILQNAAKVVKAGDKLLTLGTCVCVCACVCVCVCACACVCACV